MIEQFEELTGIDVQVNFGSTGPLAATLLEEGNNTPADIFFAQDPGGLGAVIEMLDTIPDETLAKVPDMGTLTLKANGWVFRVVHACLCSTPTR